jgi:hypothetical protein
MRQSWTKCSAILRTRAPVVKAVGARDISPTSEKTTEGPVVRRKRKPTLATTLRQAAKAGLDVARYEVDPDGKITVVTGKPAAEQTNDLDKWMAKHHAN